MTDLSERANAVHAPQIRSLAYQGMELRSLDGGANLRFSGYASVTDTPYAMADWMGDYTEVVRKGAFARTLGAMPDVPFKVNHTGITLARTKSGTMRLAEDDTGLYVEADLDPSSPAVQELRSAMERGDVDEMSFGFRIDAAQWSPDYSQLDITEVDIDKGDVSLVNYGANPATAGASLRSRDDLFTLLRENSDFRDRVADALRQAPADSQDEDATSAVLSQYALSRALLLNPKEFHG